MSALCPACGSPLSGRGGACPRCLANASTWTDPAPTKPLPAPGEFQLPDRFGKFLILREIGRGGMGVVYEADDTVMRRRVALKTLFANSSNPEIQARFQREAQIAGTLDHPNVVLVHDFGALDGILYYTMPLVEGVPLEKVIDFLHGRAPGERPVFPEIPSDAAARIRIVLEWFEGALDGLDHAHSKEIVHRDLKPSNLMLDASSGLLRITDFGLARARHLANLTREESLMGTIAYMPPEQVGRATMDVDHRADVYSMGVTLYRTLYDRLPYEANTTAAYIEKILHAPPDMRGDGTVRIPADLRIILGRSLEKSPAHRYPSAAEFAEDLRRFRRYEPIRARPVGPAGRLARWVRRRPALAAMGVVLGVALAATAALTQVQMRTARVLRAQEVAAKVESAVLEATEGNHDRAIALYTEALAREPEHFEARVGRALSRAQVPDGLARALEDLEVAGRLRPEVSGIHSLRAEYLAKRGDAAGSAREREIAASKPPHIALDFQILGDRAFMENDCPAAIGHYTRAERLEPRRYWAILRRGMCHRRTNDLASARIDNEIASHLVPDHPFAHNNLGNVLHDQGDHDRARAEYLKAVELDPNFALAWHNLGELSHALGDAGQAETLYRKALALDPDLVRSRLSLGAMLNESGRAQEGITFLQEAIRREEDRPEGPDVAMLTTAHVNLCDVHLDLRDIAAAAPHCAEAVRLQPDDAMAHYNLATWRMLSGDPTGALASLERNVELGDQDVIYLTGDEVFAPIRDDPRFKALVIRMQTSLPPGD